MPSFLARHQLPLNPIRLYRDAAGISREEFARLLGFSWRNLYYVEVGKRKFSASSFDRLLTLGADPREVALLSLLQAEWALVRNQAEQALDLAELQHLYRALMPGILWSAHHFGEVSRQQQAERVQGGAA